MKTLLLVGIVSCLIFSATAPLRAENDNDGSAYIIPISDATIPTNARLFLIASGCHAKLLAQIKEYHPVLQGTNEVINLDVANSTGTATGEDRLSFILVPSKILQPYTRYEFKLLNPPELRECCYSNYYSIWPTSCKDFAIEPYSWVTAGEVDLSPPEWKSPPTILSAETEIGNATWARVTIDTPLQEDAAYAMVGLSKAPFADAEFVLEIQDNRINLYFGCKTCTLPTCFPGEIYRVWITAMDLAGNEARAPRVVEFRIPDPPQPRRYELDIKISPRIDMVSGLEVKTSEPGLKASIEGAIELLTIVNPDGTVQDVQVLKGLPMGISTLAAESVKKWVFAGQEVADLRKVTITIKYKIFDPPYEPNWAP